MRILKSLVLLLVVLEIADASRGERTQVDADKAAEISRAIREHFRASGFNWVSPVMFRVSHVHGRWELSMSAW